MSMSNFTTPKRKLLVKLLPPLYFIATELSPIAAQRLVKLFVAAAFHEELSRRSEPVNFQRRPWIIPARAAKQCTLSPSIKPNRNRPSIDRVRAAAFARDRKRASDMEARTLFALVTRGIRSSKPSTPDQAKRRVT
ncbi:unnamed protein product, partial [Iphiclides podalirius]